MKIAMALAGEGRGHTVRAVALGQELIDLGHDLRFFTKGQSEDLLIERFGHDSLQIMPVPRFVSFGPRVSVTATGIMGGVFLLGIRNKVKQTIDDMGDWRPDICISDFEPVLPRVAKKLKVPCISFDSQHFTIACDMKNYLSVIHRMRISIVALIAKIFNPYAKLHVVSKPFSLPVRKNKYHLVGPMLRPSIENGNWEPTNTHIVCYSRAALSKCLPEIFNYSEELGLEVRLYGFHPENIPTHVKKMPISDQGFVDDLLSCNLIISTAGSQLIGEVATLGIPSILIPEPGQVEQDINARLAEFCYKNFVRIPYKKFSKDNVDRGMQCIEIQSYPELKGGARLATKIIIDYSENMMSEKIGKNQIRVNHSLI
ncbi:MAG: hypothetical protein CMD15_03505 [Flavobacteriales bacterium]|jgi:uncharacterized protein (TIGR00661 family)|nr:hypothetical protein [Flavobacteriales bacterium]RPG74856.1 MAG: hypothetical protein CBC45_003300 [Euryarchaeota archaeon TMED85]|tara:strand:+ start:14638 stop:15750 length:1113 start_codon:yes stop_codon:yes gene_type:complete